MDRANRRNDREAFGLPDDFPQRLKRFRDQSGLSWSELARRLGVYRHTVWRWKEGRALPSRQHRRAIMELAAGMGGLDRLFTG